MALGDAPKAVQDVLGAFSGAGISYRIGGSVDPGDGFVEPRFARKHPASENAGISKISCGAGRLKKLSQLLFCASAVWSVLMFFRETCSCKKRPKVRIA